MAPGPAMPAALTRPAGAPSTPGFPVLLPAAAPLGRQPASAPSANPSHTIAHRRSPIAPTPQDTGSKGGAASGRVRSSATASAADAFGNGVRARALRPAVKTGRPAASTRAAPTAID